MGPLEESLGKQMDELSGKLGDEFQTKLRERLAMFGLVDGVDSSLGGGGKGKDNGETTPGGGPRDYKYSGGGDKGAKGFEDLSSLYKRIAGAAGKDSAAQTADNTEELVKESKTQTNFLKQIASRSTAPASLDTGTPGWGDEE
jgi:hypothetical protein